jgi:hypothetical protein
MSTPPPVSMERRAGEIVDAMRKLDRREAILLIEGALRMARIEGITTGLRQMKQHAITIEREHKHEFSKA